MCVCVCVIWISRDIHSCVVGPVQDVELSEDEITMLMHFYFPHAGKISEQFVLHSLGQRFVFHRKFSRMNAVHTQIQSL
jgi:hypothetical protein